MIDKEQRALQLTKLYLTAMKGLQDDVYEDCLLIPFRKDEKVEVVTTNSNGDKTITIVNAPL